MLSRLFVLLLMDNLFCYFLNSIFLNKWKGQYFMLILLGLSAAFKLYLSGFSLMTYALLSFILVLAQSSVSLPLLPAMQ